MYSFKPRLGLGDAWRDIAMVLFGEYGQQIITLLGGRPSAL